MYNIAENVRKGLSKKVIKNIKSIERLYKPPEKDFSPNSTLNSLYNIDSNNLINNYGLKSTEKSNITLISPNNGLTFEKNPISLVNNGTNQVIGTNLENNDVNKLLRNVYKSSSNGIYNDSLWHRYAQRLRVISSLLQPTDIVTVFYSFGKIRYKDIHLFNTLFPILIKNLQTISATVTLYSSIYLNSYNQLENVIGLSIIMNSMKKLEIRNYDILDLITNEVFFIHIITHINGVTNDKANIQDITLVANSLSFFNIYHIKFWNSLYKLILIRNNQIDPLQASLLISSVAKLDIRQLCGKCNRNVLMLRLLKRRLRPAIENNELSPELISLVLHSLTKLDFEAKHFYNSCYNSFHHFILQDKVDLQGIVLYLYTSVCILEPNLEMVERCLKILDKSRGSLKSYKILKLKYIIDHLQHKHQSIFYTFLRQFRRFTIFHQIHQRSKNQTGSHIYINYTNFNKMPRWSYEMSLLLKDCGVKHEKNIYFDYLRADIYIKDFNFVILCAGPYSHYTKSHQLNKFTQIHQSTLSLKGFNIGIIPYYEWNRLKTRDDKINYLNNFGQLSSLTLLN
ncbi:uncharacterized protein TA16625 [Theileria annulata]|uniref:RAP domain-containing protein n=1 Tax=Theileria annulata TaxID=5874 RepID=Q4UIZ8_THEAN|nr:uncharacterized protein TA16625 [Theileria annulata]CAI72941.1 hypothetical protein, conserved [Theileria annulata]|eukprot:XP_953619.1 hypothetical protein, conserved [Theileria annulata]